MAGITVTTGRQLGIVAELLAHARLRNALALAPVALQLGRETDAGDVGALDALGRGLGQHTARTQQTAAGLGIVLLQPIQSGLAAGIE